MALAVQTYARQIHPAAHAAQRETGMMLYSSIALNAGHPMKLLIAVEQEADGRWIAEVAAIPGALAYGTSRADAVARVQALALRALAERIEHGEAAPELLSVEFQAA